MREVLTIILAGGRGTRLEPLTRDRAKPAVPFGGIYRIIDFSLSNCVNSGLRQVLVLTQYKAHSLDRHLAAAWSFLPRALDEYIDVVPPQQRLNETWYQGTADALYQNIYVIEKVDPKYVLVLGGDHVYKMDYGDMIRFHAAHGAALTVGCIPVPLSESRHFGVMQTDADGLVTAFREKPAEAEPMPDDPTRCLASMGIYVMTARRMYDLLCHDAMQKDSVHDFGHSLIPALVAAGEARAFPFRDRNAKAIPYWRDVGTLDAYYQANMDLVDIDPVLNLYDRDWPIRTYQPQLPPPKFVFSLEGPQPRRGEAHDSLVCQGCVVSGGQVRHSVLSPSVRVNSYARVEDSILLEGVIVGRHCHLRRTIIDKHVQVPPHTRIGLDPEHDRRRGFVISDQGVVVVPRGTPSESLTAP